MAFKGHIPWNKGKRDTPPRSAEVRRKISEGMKGKSTVWLTGLKKKPESIEKQRQKMLGQKRPWVKGHPKGWKHSPETRKKLSGSNNHRWKGGIHPVTRLVRTCFEYRQWRSDVFNRDDFTCHICNVRGGELHADHFPKTFASIMSKNKIDTYEKAIKCAELWDINNGRTLCANCHRKTDTWGTRINKSI